MHRNPAARWFIRILGTAVLCGLGTIGLLIAGAAMEPGYETSWRCDVPVAPPEVAAAFDDADTADRWWTTVDSVIPGATDSGEPAWITRRGKEAVRLLVERDASSITLRVAEPEAAVHFTRTLRLEPTPDGTRIRLTEAGTIDAKLTRAIDNWFRGVGHRAEGFLGDLSQHLGGSAVQPAE